MSTASLPKLRTSFQPILLKGHERSITQVKFNADGDLIFTSAKDHNPTVWYADNGERLGTYGMHIDFLHNGKLMMSGGHKGAVWDIDPSWDSSYVVTACADGSARMFVTTTGEMVARMPHRGAVRSVAWSESSSVFATASDPFTMKEQGCISIFNIHPSEHEAHVPGSEVPLYEPTKEIHVDPLNKATCLGWSIANEFLFAGFDSGLVIKYDANTGKEVKREKIHNGRVNRLNFNKDKTLIITASTDTTAKLVDPVTLEVIKIYQTDRPVNGAVISPIKPHVLVGGGQDAMSVTVTASSQGKFETRFYHMIYNEEFGRVKGHFGPINAIAIHPQGKSYASGAEDGFIRLHHFDAAYLNCPDYVPESLKY